MKLLAQILRFLWQLAVGLVALGCWIVHFSFRALLVARDCGRSRGRLLKDGTVVCRNGHPVPTEGTEFLIECGACGFVYSNDDGSLWLCPACEAVTPWVRCPTCSVSVASPFRWGRP